MVEGNKKKKKLRRHSAKYIKALELQVTDNQLQLWIHSVVELFSSVLLLEPMFLIKAQPGLRKHCHSTYRFTSPDKQVGESF